MAETAPFRAPQAVTVAYSVSAIDAAVLRLLAAASATPSGRPLAIGLDCESKPSFVAGTPRNRVALVQVATDCGAVLAHVGSSGALGPALSQLLSDPAVLKVGCGIAGDARYLELDFGARVAGCVDLGVLARRAGHRGGVGLAALCSEYGHALPKPKRVKLSNWSVAPLSARQVEYAANDAAASLWVFRRIHGACGRGSAVDGGSDDGNDCAVTWARTLLRL